MNELNNLIDAYGRSIANDDYVASAAIRKQINQALDNIRPLDDFMQWMKEERTLQHLTAVQFSAMMDNHDKWCSFIENAERPPKVAMMKEIAARLGYELEVHFSVKEME